MATVKYVRKMTRKDGKSKAKVKTSTKVVAEPSKTTASFAKSVTPYNKPSLASSHFHVRISKVD